MRNWLPPTSLKCSLHMLHGVIICHCPLGSGNLSTVTFHRINFFQFSYQTRYDISSRSVKKSVIFCTFTVLTIQSAQDIYNNKHILLFSLKHCLQLMLTKYNLNLSQNSCWKFNYSEIFVFRTVNQYLTTFERLCCLQLQGQIVQFHPK